jgi:hypothetical protein
MTRHIEEPTLLPQRTVLDGETYAHPAFGQIRVSRVTGGRTLYGSDFEHQTFVEITVSESHLNRANTRDWHFARNEFLTVAVSEAQWATFVSSFNQGSGVPCTIARRDGAMVPGFPLRDSGAEYKEDADETLTTAIKSLKQLRQQIEDGSAGLSKAKAKAMSDQVAKSIQELESNLPFVARRFSEHMEERVEKAKIEIHAYLGESVKRAGLEALGAKDGPLLLDAPAADAGEDT